MSLFLDNDQATEINPAALPLYAGLTIGQPDTPSALVIVERVPTDAYYVRLIRRVLDKQNVEIVAGLAALFKDEKYRNVALAVDRTTAGAPFVEYLRAQLPQMAGVVAVNLTGGTTMTGSTEFMTVNLPKYILIQTGKLVLDRQRLKNLGSFKENGARLKAELQSYQVRAGTAAEGVYAGDQRQGVHDDLVFALCLALWLGENMGVAGVEGPVAYTVPDIRAAERWVAQDIKPPADRWDALRDLGYDRHGTHPEDDDALGGWQ
jgi:hypothetical protein